MGYQNQAENMDDGPNCMILHLPSAAPMSPDNMVDTGECPWVLSRLATLARGPQPQAAALDTRSRGAVPAVHVFQKGIYTVVLANHWELAHRALEQVPARARPAISTDVLAFYGERFPGWHLALCCFDTRVAATSEPLLWWFEPLFPDRLMAAGIESHTGEAPALWQQVRRDHELVFGTDQGSPQGDLIRVDMQLRGVPRMPSAVLELMPSLAFLVERKDWSRNGDFLLDVADLARGQAAVSIGTLV